MSALIFKHCKKKGDWHVCANGCRARSGHGPDAGPAMSQTLVLLMGRPINGRQQDSYLCPKCERELKQIWDGALREREEADMDWDRVVDEPVAA